MVAKKILVTGANGYLGSGITKQLLDDGWDVVATGLANDHIDPRADFVKADLFEVENPYEFFHKPNIVLHMAWRDGFKHNSDRHVDDLPRHYHFLENMAKGGVDRICGVGSMHEIGFFEGSINESTPTNPQSLYGISKNALRDCLKLLCQQHGVIFQWIRGFYIVGNTAYGSSIFSKLIQASERGEKVFPFTQGLNQFDFTDYDEFCAMVAAVAGQSDINGIINCCSGQPKRLKDRVEDFIKENDLDIELQYGAFPDRPYDSKAVWGDNQKIQKILQKKDQK